METSVVDSQIGGEEIGSREQRPAWAVTPWPYQVPKVSQLANSHHFLVILSVLRLKGGKEEVWPDTLWRAGRVTANGASQRSRSERELAEASGRVHEATD